jgi:hypothetical protein
MEETPEALGNDPAVVTRGAWAGSAAMFIHETTQTGCGIPCV